MGKKYCDYNDIEYKGIRYVKKCMMILMKIIIKLGNAFSSNYFEYESNGDKDKIFK